MIEIIPNENITLVKIKPYPQQICVGNVDQLKHQEIDGEVKIQTTMKSDIPTLCYKIKQYEEYSLIVGGFVFLGKILNVFRDLRVNTFGGTLFWYDIDFIGKDVSYEFPELVEPYKRTRDVLLKRLKNEIKKEEVKSITGRRFIFDIDKE